MDEITRRIPPPALAAPSRCEGLEAHGVSECGPFRKGNEDAFTFDLENGLFVVADGMGGRAAGEIASRLAVESILSFVARSAGEEDLTWPYDFDASLSFDANRLRTALQLANRRVFRTGASDKQYYGMGATVVAALFNPSSLVIAHAGDSRAYWHHDGRLLPLTQDDRWVEPPDEALEAPPDGQPHNAHRNVVTRALGGEEQIQVSISERPRISGARLLLCSDGIHGALDDGRIADILASPDNARQLAERLVAEAIAAGGRDNATALVVADRK